MHKILALFCVGLVLSTASGQDCTGSAALRTMFGFANTVTNAATVTGAQYCSSIKSGPICCTASDINSLQDKTNALTTNLTNSVITRDQYYASLNNAQGQLTDALNQFQNTANGIMNNMQAALNSLSSITSGLSGVNSLSGLSGLTDSLSGLTSGLSGLTASISGLSSISGLTSISGLSGLTTSISGLSGLTTSTSGLSGLTSSLSGLSTSTSATDSALSGLIPTSAFDEINAGFKNITSNLRDFQSNRTSCVVELVKIQSAAWCLACDVNATSKGFTSVNGVNTLTISSDVCTRLKSSCYTYVANSNVQNAFIGAQLATTQIQAANKALSGMTGGSLDMTALSSLGSLGSTAGLSPEKIPADIPSSCTSASNCDWICTNFFQNGMINNQNVIAGGDTSAATSSSADSVRLLEELRIEVAPPVEDGFMSRSLQSNSFNPSDNEAGTTVTFTDNPGNVTAPSANSNSGAAMTYGSVIVAAIAVASAMML